MDVLQWILLIGFMLTSLHILLYAILQMIYMRAAKNERLEKSSKIVSLNGFPLVTIQLPMYNEKYVAADLIHKVMNMDYEMDKLEIQILDDSTDETIEIVDKLVFDYFNRGFDIKVLRRENRCGYKAGALAHGMTQAKGELLVIFDADFRPDADYLKKVIPHFFASKIGALQTRWGHTNEEESMLTKAQGILINNHFIVEQAGKSALGLFCQFNGTAGVWRKQAIIDAGGWSDDTLTEDLDLSYRAQLKGWEIKICPDIICPAELPTSLEALKIQQDRWMQGGTQTFKKLIQRIWIEEASLKVKVHATLHLTSSFVFVSIFLSALLSIPMVVVMQNLEISPIWFSLFTVGLLLNGVAFYYSNVKIAWKQKGYINRRTRFLKYFPVLLMYSIGISLNNTIGVCKGIIGIKTPFNRTPKTGQTKRVKKSFEQFMFPKMAVDMVMYPLFIGGLVLSIITHNSTFILFHIVVLVATTIVIIQSQTRQLNEVNQEV